MLFIGPNIIVLAMKLSELKHALTGTIKSTGDLIDLKKQQHQKQIVRVPYNIDLMNELHRTEVASLQRHKQVSQWLEGIVDLMDKEGDK